VEKEDEDVEEKDLEIDLLLISEDLLEILQNL
jgi:hypothetical protein